MDALKEHVKRLFATAGVDQPDNLIRRNSDGTVSVAVERCQTMWVIKVTPPIGVPDAERDEITAIMLYRELIGTNWEERAQAFKALTQRDKP